MSKQATEADICMRFITPAIERAGDMAASKGLQVAVEIGVVGQALLEAAAELGRFFQ